MQAFFPTKITIDTFGGRDDFFKSLMDVGLICNCCSWCLSTKLTLYFLPKEIFPRAKCNRCGQRSESLRRGTIFEKHGINNIAGFIFVANCFTLKIPFAATVILSGLNEQTVRAYQGYIRDMINIIIERKNLEMEHSLGGDGKVVEIDEVFLTKQKYGRGRIPAKAQTIVFGMVERDGNQVEIRDPALYAYLLKKEAHKTKLEGKRHGKELRQRQEPPRTRTQQIVASDVDGTYVNEDEDTMIINLGDDDETDDEEELIEIANEVPSNGEGAPDEPPFEIDPNMEAKEKELFGKKDRTKRNKILCFVVKDRTARTLLPIVRKYVKPNTLIFSDKWSAYFGLADGYRHYFVVHKRRFAKLLFLENRLVIKVTTNHIERIWVDLRQILRGVSKADLPYRLPEVPYRLMTMVPGMHVENLLAFLRDLASTVSIQHRQVVESPFTAVETV